ncbi:MAG: catalase [Acidobacteria bacterium]|nr:MAG: catalase [Acidobacteriota bacterium]
MATVTRTPSSSRIDALAKDLLESFDQVFGLHSGFRPVHAKGLMCSGTFTPTAEAKKLTRAPHVARASTPVIARLSDFAGIPSVPDNHLMHASPRGMAIRFYLAEHVHTDLIGHSIDSFPVRTGEEFLEFNRAIAASGPDAPKPSPVERFVASHPKAMQFVTAPKPIPTSFARESFFPVSAFELIDQAGASRFGRFRIRPELGGEYLSDEEAAKKSPNFLFDELSARLASGPVKYRIYLQLAEPGDETSDATVRWPESRREVEFGAVTLTQRDNELDPAIRKIIFDPIPRVDGLLPSNDPLFEIRAALYLLSGRRRRAATQSK